MNKKIYGIFVCVIVATIAWFIGQFYPIVGAPIFAILIGIILSRFIDKTKGVDGISFVSKKVLQYAVILLGFGLNLQVIFKVGMSSLPIIVSTIGIALITAYIFQKIFNTEKNISILIGVGSSICGGSAIAATSPIINAEDDEIAQAISVIFLFNMLAALLFPSVGQYLGLSNEGFAVFAGTAINDTSSVTAAASAWDNIHNSGTMVLDYATIVKLTRTLAIIPITFFLSVKQNKNDKNLKVNILQIIPKFIIYFILCSLATTIFQVLKTKALLNDQIIYIVENIFKYAKLTSKFFIVMALGAIGINTNINKLIKTGSKPILLGLSCSLSIIITSLIMQKLLGIL